MSSINPLLPNSQSQGSRGTDLSNVDVGEFLDLMIAELQNQDPLDPVDNAEMAQQISQIREIGATDKLTATLSAVLTGQSLATSSNLIGREVEALADDGSTVRGVVDKVTVNVDTEKDNERTYRIHVGETSFDLNKVREITQ